MSIGKLFVSAFILSTLTCSSVYAGCTRNEDVPTFNLDMVIGRVIVKPNSPVGSVLASKSYSMNGADAVYTCTGVNFFDAKVIADGAQELTNKVFTTNIPGIGLRFKRGGEVNIIYPDTRRIFQQGVYPVRLGNSTFEIEVIKTAAVTGSGRVTNGPYTTYDHREGSHPLLTTSLSADAITIVSPSCLVNGGNQQSVNVGVINKNQLTGKGTHAGGRNFELKLQCSGGVSLSGSVDIKMTFDGTLATGTSAAEGVLINEHAGNQAAQGVGIQVLNEDQTPLEMGRPQLIGTLNDDEVHHMTLKYFARFYQYLDNISTGEVRSNLVFNIDYD
ncbi:fimbrial protein [Serratia fonticola]|uniref:fimbrial protein n=1 Tax=Serratia fonticola TaxID=47917 RepID=UPI00137852DB|nr:fimbrial protein [Serratia fonticola]NBJ35391.1 fimbrial protein [Serratia fonticola]